LETAGKGAAKVGKSLTKAGVREYVSGEALKAIQQVARRLGVKLLQRTVLRYSLPIASVGIASTWNYWATKKVGHRAARQFASRAQLAVSP